ncbi:ABC transporter permease [Candidatus Woesearchaeota archaeon]|jgi:putative ABC transport system permease protein|nr:ABC transporter permease [Candidatus Woesearchaeota archaeon]MBT6044815.1 ABC transporter permease [Candidatus Woesearchaeota archaeon]
MKNNYLRVVYSSIRQKKLRSWLTLIGILIGIAAVISLMTLGEGLRTAVTGQFDLLNPDVLQVNADGVSQGPPGTGVTKPLEKYYIDDIESINGVDFAMGRIIEEAQMIFEGRSYFGYIGSMPDNIGLSDFQKIAQVEIERGEMISSTDTSKIMVGNDFTKSDAFGTPVELRDAIKVNDKKFKVKGIMKKKGSFVVDKTITMNEEVMREMFDAGERYDAIAVKVEQGADMNIVKERVENYLRKERDVDEGDEDFSIESPEEAMESLESALFGVQIFVYLIAAISIIVGGIGISNTMYTSVLEKTKEIGIMKAIGAKNSQVLFLFLTESGLLGLVGGFLGLVVGISAAFGLARVGNNFMGDGLISLNISITMILLTLLFSFLVGVISGITPAMKAAKLKPIDALRFTK